MYKKKRIKNWIREGMERRERNGIIGKARKENKIEKKF
jgi:hypothetical protein